MEIRTSMGRNYLSVFLYQNKALNIFFTGHFFDRISERLFDSNTDRSLSIAYFSHLFHKSRIIENFSDPSEITICFEGGVGKGRIMMRDDKHTIIQVMTYLTHEMCQTGKLCECAKASGV